MYRFLLPLALVSLAACDRSTDAPPEPPEPPAAPSAQAPAPPATPQAALARVLDAQPDDVKARYQWRHPKETLSFFGIKPGMTVVEALPGGGWYSKILLDYLGPDGHLIGADYAQSMWPLFEFFPDDFIAKKESWVDDWPKEAEGWRDDDDAKVSAFKFGSMPDELEGTADAVLFIRALHNLNRFEEQGGYRTAALEDAFRALKPGGVLGVVQHHARDEMPDTFVDGSKGYLKRQQVIDFVTNAGFELEGSSNINANPNDQPGEEDIVWRLPPTLITSREDPDLRAELEAIGETNRMTLKFRKPE